MINSVNDSKFEGKDVEEQLVEKDEVCFEEIGEVWFVGINGSYFGEMEEGHVGEKYEADFAATA